MFPGSRQQAWMLLSHQEGNLRNSYQICDLYQRGEDRSLLPGKKDDSKSSPGEEVAAKTGDRFPHFVLRSDPEAEQP